MNFPINRSNRTALCILAGFCLLHVIGVMSYLLRDGRLSMVPIYDDVAYLIDGLSRMAVLDRQGILRCLFDFYANPPHAPLVALTSLLGLMLSAGAPWGPYLLSAGWVVLVLLLGWVALRHANQWTRTGVLVGTLAIPMFGFVLAEFRPDAVWGLLVGFAVAVSASTDKVWTCPAKQLVALGLLFGVAIVSKPTAAPASIAVLAIAWFAQVGVSLLTTRELSIGGVARASGWAALGAACVVIPYMAANGAAILNYIREVMGGESMWRTQASALGHLTYYLNRGTGTLALGWAWYAAIPLFAGCATLIVWLRDKQSLPAFAALMAATASAYLIVTLSAVKSLMIGSLLYGTIVAAVVWSLGYLLTRIPFRGRAVLVLGVVVFATQWVPRTGQIHREDPSMLAADTANRAVLPALTDILRARPNAVVLVTVPGPAYAGTLDFLSRQQGVVRTFMSGYTSDSWERVQQTASSADVIVLSEVGMVGQSLGYSFPSLKHQTRLLDELRTGRDFTGGPAFTDTKNRSVWLFVRNGK